jgi:uncharacterized membrane protein
VTKDKQREREPLSEENVYADVYRVLLGGMIVSVLFFLAGVVRALMHPEPVPLGSEWIRSHYHWRAVVEGLRAGDATTLAMLGTILLILTPVARVLISIYAFFVDRDYQYVVVTGIVFLVMVLTVVLAHLGLT